MTTKPTPAEIAEEQRKKINVVSTNEALEATEEKEESTEEASEEKEDDKTNDDKSIETPETKEEKEVEAKEEEVEASEEKEEQLEEEKKAAETQAEKDKIQRRIDREVAKRKALETQIAELQKQLEAKPDAKLTEEEVEKRANDKAAKAVAEKEFVQACNRLADAGNKLDKKFNEKIQDMAEDIGPIPTAMIGILDDLDNGADVLKHLAEDHELALKMYGYSPAKMGVELAKLSTKIATPTKKPISKVPNPPNPVGGNSRANVQLNDKMSDKEWIRERQKQLREKGKLHLL